MCDEDDNVPMSEIATEAAAIEWAEQRLGWRKDAFLRKHGWTATSSTPGCTWMWERKLTDGRTVLVDRESAISMTRAGDYLGKL